MNIELTSQQMQTILASGLLHPSDIGCLDLETRNQLKDLCLKLCKPSHCATCDMHGLCQQAFQSQTTVNFPMHASAHSERLAAINSLSN